MPGRAARTKPAQQQAVAIKADAPLTPEERERAATGQSIEDSPELIFGLFPATGERKFEWPEYWESGKPVHIQMPPQMEWRWLTETGQTFAITIRDATLKGLCVTYGLGPDGWQWHWGGQPDNRPLLYLPTLLQHPQDTIVLVEGEKTADAARRLLPEGFQATTWMGGANAIGKTDWAKLTGRNVVIWPDNDAAGTNAAFRIARQLNNIGAHASVVDLNSVSAKLPEKWDLADPFPAGITPADVLDVIRRTLNRTEDTAASIGGGAPKTLSPIKHLPPEEDPTNPDGAVTEEEKAARRKEAAKHGIDREITIRPLGYLGGKFYFQSAAMQDVRGFTPRDMDNLATWMGLYPDMTYWRSQLDGAELSPRSLSERFMKECAFGGTNTKERRPFFSPSILRGRGCWIDNDRTVFHAGDELTVDGIACEPIALNSRYVYARGERFMDLGRAEPLSAKTGTELRALSHMMPWKDDNPLLADLFVGLIASAPICGAMDFRSHAWISGPSGSGKAQPHSAKVLTPSGWSTMGEMKPGDYVTAPDGGFGKVLRVHPQGRIPVYRLTFQDGRSTLASGEHLWKVREEGAWRLRTTTEMKVRFETLATAERQMAIQATTPVPLRDGSSPGTKKLPMHPYILGALLGDGYLGTEKSGSGAAQVSLSTLDPHIIQRAQSLCADGTYFTPDKSGRSFTFKGLASYGKRARDLIRDLKLLGARSADKFIPEDYLSATVEDRWELLRGLMDTDGTVGKANLTVSYCTISPQLRDDVTYLIRSLGGIVHCGSKIPHYTHKGERRQGQRAYILSIRLPDPRLAFSLPRKLERLDRPSQYAERFYLKVRSIEPAGEDECSCITIDHPDRLYITDDFIVTHNSWSMDHFAGKCLGSIALYPLGNSTEAGIRAFIKSDARPVFFDEAEGSKDISNIQRRDAIISLMRSSSTNQRGKIYKGTSDQGGMSFEIRSMFFMSSIGVGLKEWADENRCLVLDLRGPGADTAADRTKRKETFAKLQAGLRKFPPALDASLMARMVTRVTQVLHTTKLFSTILQHHLGSTGIKRVGDLIGTPLAALWWLCHDEAPSDDIAAEAFLSGYDFSPWTRTPETREDISLFRHLTSQVMLATLRGGERGERSIGDMMLVISGSPEADQKIDKEEAATALMNRGIRYDWHEARAGFWIAKHHHRMDDLMKGSWFQDGWFGVLASHPEAKTAEANKTIRFGAGVKTTAIFIPIEVLLPE